MTDVEMTAEERERALDAKARAWDLFRDWLDDCGVSYVDPVWGVQDGFDAVWDASAETASAPYERALAAVTVERDRLQEKARVYEFGLRHLATYSQSQGVMPSGDYAQRFARGLLPTMTASPEQQEQQEEQG